MYNNTNLAYDEERCTIAPMVSVKKNGYETVMDLGTRLLKDRIISLNGEVNDMTAEIITNSLLILESEDSDAPITLFINSPGGSVSAGMSIFDTMQYVSCPVYTIATGLAASMGSFLLAAGEPSMGATVVSTPSRWVISMPMPIKLPLVSSSSS